MLATTEGAGGLQDKSGKLNEVVGFALAHVFCWRAWTHAAERDLWLRAEGWWLVAQVFSWRGRALLFESEYGVVVGCNIADSTISSARRGARTVLGVSFRGKGARRVSSGGVETHATTRSGWCRGGVIGGGGGGHDY